MMITCAFCGDVAPDRGIWLKPGPGGRQAPLLELMDRQIRHDSKGPICVHVLCGHCDQAMQDLKDTLDRLEAPA